MYTCAEHLIHFTHNPFGKTAILHFNAFCYSPALNRRELKGNIDIKWNKMVFEFINKIPENLGSRF